MWPLLSIPYMSILSRAHGGGKPHLPWSLDAWLLAAPYLLYYEKIGWWVVPAYAGAVLSIRAGHGRGFDYHLPFEAGSKPEKVEWLIPSSIPVAAQKALIMALTGLGVTLLLALSLLFHNHPILALILALSGLMKSAAYLLPKTEWAEYARGGFLGLGVAVTL